MVDIFAVKKEAKAGVGVVVFENGAFPISVEKVIFRVRKGRREAIYRRGNDGGIAGERGLLLAPHPGYVFRAHAETCVKRSLALNLAWELGQCAFRCLWACKLERRAGGLRVATQFLNGAL